MQVIGETIILYADTHEVVFKIKDIHKMQWHIVRQINKEIISGEH